MGYCIVPGCHSNSVGKLSVGADGSTKIWTKKRLHSFPSNPILREKWINIIKRDNWRPSYHSKICEDHFDDDCYEINPLLAKQFHFQHRLKPDAVPTHFPNINIKTKRARQIMAAGDYKNKVNACKDNDVFYQNKIKVRLSFLLIRPTIKSTFI